MFVIYDTFESFVSKIKNELSVKKFEMKIIKN